MKQEIKFIYETQYTNGFAGHCGTPKRTEVLLSANLTLPELLQEFELFVKAIGYYPPENAHLDYVDNDTEEKKEIP